VSGFRPRFFVDQDALASGTDVSAAEGTEVTLSADDSHHALRVLRLRAGDACEVVLGAAVYAASVSSAKAPVRVAVTARLQEEAAGAVYRSQVGLVQALTRPALLDQVFEKGTEVGTSFFVLVPAVESTRLPESSLAGRMDRWRRIVVEAAKQSKHLNVPTVELSDSVGAALEGLSVRGVLSLLLQPCAPVSLREKLEQIVAARAITSATPESGVGGLASSIALWIGPESGWSSSEVEQFTAAGIEAVTLGQGVLRAETAGPVAVAVTRLILGDW
jgi:16S rRNA (uracil1498-N3)-methyltransferase